jgi:hypothetical protein
MPILVLVILGSFTLMSIIYQVKYVQKRISVYDKFHLLPNYSFFAPRPFVNDYRLVYTMTSDKENEWIEIPMYSDSRLHRMFWNPFKYYNKGMIDSCHLLLIEFKRLENKNFIRISTNYINLLMVIAKYLGSTGKREKDISVRFAILACEGADAVKIHKVLFSSYSQLL